MDWLLDELKNKDNLTKKTLVFCKTIISVALLYHHFSTELNVDKNCLTNRTIAMHHRATCDLNKKHVYATFFQGIGISTRL